MRCKILVLLFAFLVAPAVSWGDSPAPLSGEFGAKLRPVKEFMAAPEIAFKDDSGRDWGFVEFRGKVVIAMFWATWCPICAKEMPKLDALQGELRGEGLQVVALSQDSEGPPVVVDYYARRGIQHLGVYHDPGSLMASIVGIRGVPTVFVIDKAGRVVGVVEGGADWGSPEAKSFLRHYLTAAES